MKCILCDRVLPEPSFTIKDIPIYECRLCELCITSRLLKVKELPYEFKSYDREKVKYSKRFNKLLNYIQQQKKTGTLLEIGSGYGLFASLAAEANYNVTALEPHLSLDYVQGNSKVRCLKLDFDNFIKDNTKKYNIVVLLDVFEHLDYPVKVLSQIRKILQKDGLLVIQVPNYKSFMARLSKNWAWWMVEDHRYHFSYHSIKKTLGKGNFKIVFADSYEDFIDFKKNLDGNFSEIKNAYKRKLLKLLYFSAVLPLYFTFRSIFWKFKRGGLIFVIAQDKTNSQQK